MSLSKKACVFCIRKPVKPGSNFRVLFTKNYVKKSTLLVDFLTSLFYYLPVISNDVVTVKLSLRWEPDLMFPVISKYQVPPSLMK